LKFNTSNTAWEPCTEQGSLDWLKAPYYCQLEILTSASFCNFFLQLPKYSKSYVVQCFQLFPGILYCNFFDFSVQFFTAILSSIARNEKV